MKRIIKLFIVALSRLRQYNCYKKCLKPGLYSVTHNFKCYYLNNVETKTFVRNHFPFLQAKALLLVLNLSNRKKGGGDLILFSNTTYCGKPASYKVFYISDQYVRTIYNDKQKLIQDIEGYNKFSAFFPIPQILSIDEENKIIMEEIITHCAIERTAYKDKSLFFENILKCYIKYFDRTLQKGNITSKQLFEKCCDYGLPTKIKAIISRRFIEIVIPCYFLHGDLSPTNVLDKKGTPVFIDFEHCGEYVFFYDIFWYIKDYCTQFKDYTLLNDYVHGKYDKLLEVLFEAVSLQYDKNLRIFYFMIFLMSMYLHRGVDLCKVGKQTVENNIQQLIDKMEGIEL